MGEGFPESRLTFARVHGGRIQIGPFALTMMRRYVQDTMEKAEAGGVLLGRHILGSDDIIVDTITEPMPGDRRSRFQFFRARRRHQREINQAWQESEGTCTYLGEWHTHPESSPVPSCVDRCHWQQTLLKDRRGELTFFVIVGISEISVWESQYDHQVMPLRLL